MVRCQELRHEEIAKIVHFRKENMRTFSDVKSTFGRDAIYLLNVLLFSRQASITMMARNQRLPSFHKTRF
jgi:hypothetical protein